MFKELLQKMTDWSLEKEEEATKNCSIPIKTIEKQLSILTNKRDELVKKCDEQKTQFDEIINRIEKMKNNEILKCGNKK